jgi:hypothetical protein
MAKLVEFYLQWRRRYRGYRYWGTFFNALCMSQLVLYSSSKFSPVECAENNNDMKTPSLLTNTAVWNIFE